MIRSPRRLAIIGAGRTGTALGLLLSRSGWNVSAVASRRPAHARRLARRCHAGLATTRPEEAARHCEVVLIAVPDRDIAEVARRLALAPPAPFRRIALHTSGATGLRALAPLARRGWSVGRFHPLTAFRGGPPRLSDLRGTTFGVGGDSRALGVGRSLATSLGGLALHVPERHRTRYHLAACLASNYVVTLAAEAARLLEGAGLPRRRALLCLMPLMKATLGNLDAVGVPRALTGPVSRADLETLAGHAELLAREAPSLARLHRDLVRRTARLALEAGYIDEAGARRIGRSVRTRRKAPR